MSPRLGIGSEAGQNPSLHWLPERFTLDPRRTAVGETPFMLDVTGPPRPLVFGPYVDLEPGVWRARVRFTVDETACKHHYRLEWGSLTDFASHAFVPGRPGVYNLEIDHRWQATAAAETRLILTEGALDGMLEFQGVTVSRLS
tara:strand:- start:8223 stop:8651 length:429 start_codon:yes stop_codon:yes gene_type:complete